MTTENLKLKGFTDEEVTKIIRAMHSTWAAIAADVGTVEGWRGTLGEIIEVTLDADRPLMYGFYPSATETDKALWKRFEALGWKEMEKFARKAMKGY